MEMDFDKIARQGSATVPDGFFASQRVEIMARVRRHRQLVLLRRSVAAAAVTIMGIMCFHHAATVDNVNSEPQMEILLSEYSDTQLSDAAWQSEAEYLFDPQTVGYNY